MALMGNKNTKSPEFNPNLLNLINSGTEVIGDIISNGDVRIDGILRGTVNTKAKLVIGQTGIIEGDVKAQNSDISGQVKGNIMVDDLLVLKSNGKITGDITTKKIIVETGGEFNGKCQMQSSGIKNAAPASAPQQKA